MGSVRSLVEEQLRLARERNPQLHALIRTLDESALAEAAQAEAAPGGSLHGITVSLKDNIDVAGVLSTAGSPHHGREPAVEDATVTRLLRAAGAVIVAKNNMAEFAMGVVGRNDAFGDARNARDARFISGGSSSGSGVAVASGMSTVSLGTDTGGSGRVPAAVNGVVGIRPTLGRVSNRGVLPVGKSFDTVTPIARDVRTAAAVLATLDWHDPQDPTSVDHERVPVDSLLDNGIDGLRIGVAGGFFREHVDPGVRSVVDSAVEKLTGAREIEVPGAALAQEKMLEIMYPEAVAVHARRLRDEPDTIDADVLRRLRIGQGVTAGRAARAREWQRDFRRQVDALFETCDVVLTPTIPVDVPRRDAVDLVASTQEIGRFCYVWSCYGGPALSLPCGTHPRSGMPVGLQLTAAPWQEHHLLQAAAHFEKALALGQGSPRPS
ncbi:amidase [Amycolatopsis jiangsuensis]|uniref:Aspartyl-tRNA(Asn)/glutamyl-tRNA(Gln) amidotransferase subunit A n=1 Tax=Amycolatopsis jiangsuensis TaxID=1181879 RepID=A0A840J5A6_9PSEU|nr:amidase [Amycolatopsis jiangsuensis]MBB4688617.1 aspartyl-tRNA(Asn)/glutamyl-tRNA(Gln) amidotransferase subunit A [Amycolatopsis jiangsuensis]